MLFFPRRLTGFVCAVLLLLLTADAGAGGGERAFLPGERLTFQIKWGPIPAGEAVLEVRAVEGQAAGPVYHFVMEVRTSEFLDPFYYYRSRIDAYAEVQMNRSLQYRQVTQTGRKTKDVVVDFDWQANTAHFRRTETFSPAGGAPHVKTLETPLLPGTFDPLSAFYYTRMLTLREEALIERPVSDGKRTLNAQLEVIGRETITLRGRSYDTFVVRPDLKGVNPVFEKEAGAPILIWVTADAYRIPVKLKSEVSVGSFTGELVAVEGLDGTAAAAGAGRRGSNLLAKAAGGHPEP